jgi:hypothetical protein
MEASLRQLLTDLEEVGRYHDAQEPDYSRKMLNLEPATAHLLSMLVREVVDLNRGDATQVVATLAGPFDCVFFDADRKSAPSQLALLLPKLTAEVFLLADNALSHPQEIAAYLAAVQALPQFEHLIIPIGKGSSMAYRQIDNAALLGGTP